MASAGIRTYSDDPPASDIYSAADMVRSIIPGSCNGLTISNTGDANLFYDLPNCWIDGRVRMDEKSGWSVCAACSMAEFAA